MAVEQNGSRHSLDDWIDAAIAADPQQSFEDEIVESESGPPLGATELRTLRDKLSNWQPPSEFKRLADAACARYKSREWFSSPRVKFLHDAYVLARFARDQKVDRVRLSPMSDQWPDGYARIGRRVHNIEITSTHGGRKLSDEYRNVDPELKFDPVEDWIARAESAPKYLEKAITTKVKKHYGSDCWLVVYLNTGGDYGIRQKQTAQAIASVKASYVARFEAISVYWNGKFY